jgi:hypothetical protein
MLELSLINIKESEKKFILDIKKFYPIKNNLKKYMIKIKSNEPQQLNFCLYEKLMKFVQIKHNKISYKYYHIPSDGILISCIITKDKPLEITIDPIDLCSEITIKQVHKKLHSELELINISWDNIFIINLKRRSDRKIDIQNKLNEQNINKYEFIEAIDGTESDINEQFTNAKKNLNISIISAGHFACLLSHIKAIKLAKSRNYSSIMILEDDIYFCKDFIYKLSKLMIPNYDMIYLGGIISKKKLFFNDWIRYTNIMGAYGYILTSNLFDIVINQLENLTEYVDVFYMKKIQPNYSIILLFDYIKTDLASSDTSHKSQSIVKRLNYIKIR